MHTSANTIKYVNDTYIVAFAVRNLNSICNKKRTLKVLSFCRASGEVSYSARIILKIESAFISCCTIKSGFSWQLPLLPAT